MLSCLLSLGCHLYLEGTAHGDVAIRKGPDNKRWPAEMLGVDVYDLVFASIVALKEKKDQLLFCCHLGWYNALAACSCASSCACILRKSLIYLRSVMVRHTSNAKIKLLK